MKHMLGGASIVLALVMPLLAGMRPLPGEPVAAIFPPWWDPARIALSAMAGGTVAGFGRVDFVVLLPRADPGRLHAAGAWMVIPASLGSGCAGTVNRTEDKT